MSTVLEPKTAKAEERFLLTDISWPFYKAFCDELTDRRIRLTYDEGLLEIMVIKRPHEFFKTMLADLIRQIVLYYDIPIASGGSMTCQREDLKKGFEPDECWWIAHEAIVRGREELDFTVDPSPDLAIEVEITSSLVNRVGIYASLRVPEIWRFDGTKLRFCVLANDTYLDAQSSLAFPFLRPEHLEPFLKLDTVTDETTRIREFIRWLETHESQRLKTVSRANPVHDAPHLG
jgi:Uma2 family endonuclease